jgi:hypothetical protein
MVLAGVRPLPADNSGRKVLVNLAGFRARENRDFYWL